MRQIHIFEAYHTVPIVMHTSVIDSVASVYNLLYNETNIAYLSSGLVIVSGGFNTVNTVKYTNPVPLF